MCGALACGLTRFSDGPIGMFPGGAFRAEAASCPRAWDPFASAAEVELEVRPAAPRSLTTWSVVLDGTLYIPADFLTPFKRWPHQVLANPRVRLRLGDRVFACRASRVEDGATLRALRAAIAAKYGIASDGRAARVEVWWFRISDP